MPSWYDPLTELILTCSPAGPLRSADRLLLLVPQPRSVRRSDRAFSAFASKLWQSLPFDPPAL